MSGNKPDMGDQVGKGVFAVIDTLVDGENPAKDAAIGVGVGTAALTGFCLVVAAPITLPALAVMGAICGVGAAASGQTKKRDRTRN